MSVESRQQVSGELLDRCRAGDRDAFFDLFDQTAEDVRRILYRLVGPDSDVDDLVQEVYLGLWRSIGRFRGDSSFSTYLFSICHKTAKKHGRSWFRFSRLRETASRQVTESRPTPDAEVASSQRAAAVQNALGKMSFKLRTVLVLFEMEGFSGKEIAQQLEIPEKTVWTRLHHARKDFRRRYRWKEILRTSEDSPKKKDGAPL